MKRYWGENISIYRPAEITEPPKISGGQNHKYDRLVEYFHKKLMITSIAELSYRN
jgi:hypothetical protein